MAIAAEAFPLRVRNKGLQTQSIGQLRDLYIILPGGFEAIRVLGECTAAAIEGKYAQLQFVPTVQRVRLHQAALNRDFCAIRGLRMPLASRRGNRSRATYFIKFSGSIVFQMIPSRPMSLSFLSSSAT